MCALLPDIIKQIFTLVAVALGSVVALRVYFRQKDYELTKQRYLEGGVDVVAAELEASSGVVSHNYARCLQICRSFRDVGDKFDVKELDRSFAALDNSKFHRIAHHRVGALLQSDVVWEVYQAAMAEAVATDALITKEVPEAIRLISAEPPGLRNRQDAVEQMLSGIRKAHDDSFKYATLLRELHELGSLLESTKLSLKAVAKFHKRAEVQAIVARLREAFPRDADRSVSMTLRHLASFI